MIHGTEDGSLPFAHGQALANAIPGAKLVMIPGVGHLALFEKPDAVNAPLEEFFAGR